MPKITDEVPFGGAPEMIACLGLTELYEEVKAVVGGFFEALPIILVGVRARRRRPGPARSGRNGRPAGHSPGGAGPLRPGGDFL